MRVNIYAEEITNRVELVSKVIDGHEYIGVRFYLYLPVSMKLAGDKEGKTYAQMQGPFIHREGDDDSSAVTFWGKKDLIEPLEKALALIREHYKSKGVDK